MGNRRKVVRKAKVLFICILFSLIALLIMGCSTTNKDKKDDEEVHVEEDILIVAEWSPAGPDEINNMFNRKISVDHDGTLVLSTNMSGDGKLTIEEDAPTFTIHLEKEEVNHIKKEIKDRKFFKLPKDVSTPSDDGSYSYLTVKLEDKTKKVGGLNPNQERFVELHDYIFSLVHDDDYEKWQEDMKEYIRDKNE